MSAYAYFCMHMQARSMHTHTTSLRLQAYVRARILVPRNLNFDFPISFALFVLPNMPLF